ncbi:MAG: LysM peptidoglycan-binding domain-containing protein [Bacteroidota bacterium]
MYRVLCAVVTALFVLGCSEKPVQRTEQSQTSLQKSSSQTPILFASASPTARLDFPSLDTVPARASVEIVEQDSIAVDSNSVDDEKDITELLEIAREHYLAALQAQTEGDSATSALEFEEAIKHLNEASYYPDIETNADFNELTKSVIEDYEKYIATIDSLGPQSSIFALREKLNFEIEKIDITNLQIPPSLIPKTEVPLHINEYSKRAIAFFMSKGRGHMENWIYRSGKYFPLMSRIFAEEGLPTELMYLSMPESGLNPVARSWAKAVGLWQFMKHTGALYGLRSTYWYDERRDFEKATRAAARHMKDLYNEFNDWHLVFVAYNAGPGWVKRAIRRTGSTDFWEMRHRLPRETRNYVPQYIAVTLIAMRPEAFGFSEIQKADSLAYEYVTVDDCVALELLAECADTDVETLRELNPELTQWCTPPNYKGYQLRIPFGKSQLFAERYAQIPDDKKFDFATHNVRRGETIGTIARKYGVQASVLFEVNKISRRTKLRIGQTLVIPIQSKSVAAVVEAQRKKEIEDRERAKRVREQQRLLVSSSSGRKVVERMEYQPEGRAKLLYKVKKGETLGHIAEWFHVRASHIRNWNNIPYGRYIYPGQTLKIWVPEERYEEYKKIAALSFEEKQKAIKRTSSSVAQSPKEELRIETNWVQHKVKRGESLEKIARRYDVAVADIKKWNKLRTSRINAGAVLEIYSPGKVEDVEENGTIPKKQQLVRAPKLQPTKPITHIVRKGETLEKIAEKYNVTISDVKKWNRLNGSRIYVGQKLIIQREGEPA